jgi:hypothetical protein
VLSLLGGTCSNESSAMNGPYLPNHSKTGPLTVLGDSLAFSRIRASHSSKRFFLSTASASLKPCSP